jgi:SpoIID/LytB domain protein
MVGILVGWATLADGAAGVRVDGHGYGHGRGMGQWGSYGYAVDRGWDHSGILNHFYGGTTPGSVDNDWMSVRITALDGVNQITLFSGAGYAVEGMDVPGGTASRFTRNGNTWLHQLVPGGCSGTPLSGSRDVGPSPPVSLPGEGGPDLASMFTVCNTGITYRGNFRPVVDSTGTSRLVNFVRMETYLRGVVPREVPASWADAGGGRGLQAVKAQAVAARSYAATENRYPYARTCDSTSCQVYGGAGRAGTWLEDARTDRAVLETSGQVRVRDGRVMRTEFSSSTGGWTAGGDFPAVIDEGDVRSPYHNWSVFLTAAKVQTAFPSIGTFDGLRVVSRNGLGGWGGRVLSLDVVGSRGVVRTTGEAFRMAMGLRSSWFTVTKGPELGWLLRDAASPGPAGYELYYGAPGMTPLACDLTGNGRDSNVVYTNGRWYMRTTLSEGAPDLQFSYGFGGAVPVCGDWDGDGDDTIGVYYNGTWYLRNSNTPGPPDLQFSYGFGGTRPVVGDWDGDGRDGIGVYHPATGTWYTRQTASPGPAATVQYGWSAATPITGDWDGNRTDTLGLFYNGRWLLRDTLTPGNPTRAFTYGWPGTTPITGNWDTTPATGIGVIHVVG